MPRSFWRHILRERDRRKASERERKREKEKKSALIIIAHDKYLE
jgi:hypothetical protein